MKKLFLCMIMVMGIVGLTGCSGSKNISKDEAKEKALKEVNGEVIGYNQDLDDDDTPHYEFNIVQDGKCYEVKVHSKTGEIISKELDKDYQQQNDNSGSGNSNSSNGSNSNNNTNNNVATPTINADEAKQIALQRVGGGTVTKCELGDSDDTYGQTNGAQVYEIEIRYNSKEYDVLVNGNTKEIIKVEESFID